MFEIPSVAGNIDASTQDVCTFVPKQLIVTRIAGSITHWIVEAIGLSFRKLICLIALGIDLDRAGVSGRGLWEVVGGSARVDIGEGRRPPAFSAGVS